MADALYFGHPGNDGDALRWGGALGAATRHLGAFQGHGSVASPHGILVTWALMSEGGIQVDRAGRRFSNEHDGYSEQARRVLALPGATAWNVYDRRLHELGLAFDDYRRALRAGAVREGRDATELAAAIGAPELPATLAEVRSLATGAGADRFGRDFTGQPPLAPPLHAVRVTGALFHTQAGWSSTPVRGCCAPTGHRCRTCSPAAARRAGCQGRRITATCPATGCSAPWCSAGWPRAPRSASSAAPPPGA